MDQSQPHFDPDKYLKLSQNIFERMARAKWVTDPNPVNSNPWWKALTELGLHKVGKISDALIRNYPAILKSEDVSAPTMVSSKQPTSLELNLAALDSAVHRLNFALSMIEVQRLIAELEPPRFSQKEEATFTSMLYYFAHENAKQLIPPTPGYRPPPV
jgi:hypothetical protein